MSQQDKIEDQDDLPSPRFPELGNPDSFENKGWMDKEEYELEGRAAIYSMTTSVFTGSKDSEPAIKGAEILRIFAEKD